MDANKLDRDALDKFQLDTPKIFIRVVCKRCGNNWGILLTSLEQMNYMSRGWNVCLDCAEKDYVENITNN